jgi:hypothetical protein
MASRGPLLLAALWLTAAVTATSVGLLAVHLVGNEVGAQVAAPLSEESVRQALVSVSPTPSRSAASPSPRAADDHAEGRARTVVTSGGVVSARCSDGRPKLLYATPAEGYRTERGARTVAFVGSHQRVTLTLRCSGDDLRTATSTQAVDTGRPSPTPVVRPTPTESPEHEDEPEHSSSTPPYDREVESEPDAGEP